MKKTEIPSYALMAIIATIMQTIFKTLDILLGNPDSHLKNALNGNITQPIVLAIATGVACYVFFVYMIKKLGHARKSIIPETERTTYHENGLSLLRSYIFMMIAMVIIGDLFFGPLFSHYNLKNFLNATAEILATIATFIILYLSTRNRVLRV